MSTLERSIVTLRAPIELKGEPGSKNRQFRIEAYTGKAVTSWWGNFVIDIAGIQTKEKVPILREHMRDRIVGWSEKTEKSPKAISLAGIFSNATPDGKEVLALADEGFPWQASMGIKPLQIKLLKNADETIEVNGRKFNGPMEIWTKSMLGETSMVAWGADSDTSMTLLSEGEKLSVDIENCIEGAKVMNMEELKAQHPDLYGQVFKLGADSVPLAAEIAKAKAEGEQAERTRVTEIMSAKGDAEVTRKAITEGLTAEASFKLFFQAEKTGREKALADMQAGLSDSAGGSGKEKPKGDAPKGAEYLTAVDAYQKEHNCKRSVALSAVARKNPELHEAYVLSQQKKGE
ncbi:MAG: hypothetical protein V2B18_21230 [Pseudomonadota bacterium]